MTVLLSLLATLTLSGCSAAWVTSAPPRAAATRCRRSAAPISQIADFPEDEDGGDSSSDDDADVRGVEDVSDDERGQVEDFRAQMLRQMLGDSGAAEDGPSPVDAMLKKAGVPVAPPVRRVSELAPGQILVANPERFCSRNPFSRPVKDLGRFGLQGPIDLGEVSADFAAQMLPVVFLTQHSKSGSRGLLMERRTGALMGDVSMEDYGCVAISPLWLGGTSNQNSLYVLHDVDNLRDAEEVTGGLFLGGWGDARPKVSDRSLGEGRFKFFLGATEWGAGQLEDEFRAGAWVVLKAEPSIVIKDRVASWRPGQPKPVWTELVKHLGEEGKKLVEQVYPEEQESS